MNLTRVWAVTYKEWREILRDRLFFAMAFLLPVGIFMVLGYGISFDVEKIPFAVLDLDRSAMSRDFLHRFMDSRYFDYQGHVTSERELDPLLANSDIRFAIIIPPRFQEQLLAGQATSVQSLIDGVFPYRAEVAKGYVSAIIANFNAQSLVNHLAGTQGKSQEQARAQVAPLRLESRYLYNQALRSQWSISSGLMMLVLMVTPPFLTALGVVREKENGSIYNIYASTISRSEFILGKFLPYLLISSLNILILWWVVMNVFGTPFKGHPFFYYAASVIYVICTAGVGLLISLLVRTQVAAVMLTMVVSFVPAMLYSGLLVPIESMAAATQFESHLFPTLYYLRITWGSFLKGLGWEELWFDVLALMLYAVILWIAGYMNFHKRPST
ncbi:MAG: ABC transporter permease [Methylicorpusculum sp.]|uniref:ABC transporter permease n=1 Tax=Methylicorpusculum sp. TaxID=2713644 RepID=UPI00271D39B9|nr:ABC transporter permease [Methylicorpusculum sp.]MDO8843993.1 ABC transporter permease [Methylicorpusculum sp.]MDO8939057.1 ABC transporter permease [Methylicorpusculum sp.]MDO9242133.1 ABC transporter permease [Methylicorpusculum sp.]MDP2177553.1 ABC transporter permease [Methylicorpusculum sp.]MDP2202926.1 ABC transporter permease [Methylicorpusculum sp.]